MKWEAEKEESKFDQYITTKISYNNEKVGTVYLNSEEQFEDFKGRLEGD